jgi:hypothetical protein
MIDSAFRGLDIFDEQLLAEELTSEDAEVLLRKFYKDDKFVLSVVCPPKHTNQRKDN